MKKLILAVASLFACIGVNAQMTPIQKVGATKTIATVRFNTIELNRSANAYYICITETGNRFDSPFLFSLGKDKSQSLITIEQLINNCGELKTGESIIVKNPYNKFEVRIYKDNEYAGGVLVFQTTGVAGTPSITKKELLKFQKALEKYSE